MNQVYFPHYKEIKDVDGNAYILVSHPTTQKAYKIKISEFDIAVAAGLISTDATNGLTIGADGLLFVEATDTLYSADGTLSGDRAIDADGNDLTVSDAAIITLTTTGTGSQLALTTTSAALTTSSGFGNSNVVQSATSLELRVTDLVNLMKLNIAGDGTNGHINFTIPAASDLQINGNAGTSGYVLQSTGANTPPVWKKKHHTETFSAATWGAGTTVTIVPATHGLTADKYHVTVYDNSNNIVPITATVLTGVNVAVTGAVILTILNNGLAFAGSVHISL